MQHRDGGAAKDLAQQHRPAGHGRDEYFAKEPELPIPDHGYSGLHRGIHDVEHDDRGEDELYVSIGNYKANLPIDLSAEIGVQSDSHDQQPQDRAADAADKLASVA